MSGRIRASELMGGPRSPWQWFSTNLATNGAILIFNAAVVAILWGSASVLVASDREEAVRATYARVDNMAIALQQYAGRTLDSADAVMRSLVREHARSGRALDLPQFISENRVGRELLMGVGVADERGNASIASSGDSTVKSVNVADREHFKVHVDSAGRRLFIGKPVIGRLSGKPVIPITQRLSKADGTFGGVAMVLIEPAALTGVLRNAEIGPRDIIAVIGLDGVTRARMKGAVVTSGEDVSRGPLFAQLPKGRIGSYKGRGALDGIARLYSYRVLPDRELVATVGTPEAEALAGHYERRERYLWAAGLASAVLTGFALLVMFTLSGRKRSEQALWRQHALLANAQRVGGMGIWELEIANDRVTWSAETHRIFGVAAGAFGGTYDAFVAFVHPEDAARLRALHARSPPGGDASVEAEYRIVRPDGEERVVFDRGETTFDAAGTPLRRVGVVMDITERRRTENALREAELKYRSIFENATEGIFQNTADGRMLSANPAMARMLGFDTPEELIRSRTDLARQSYAEPAQREAFMRLLQEHDVLEGFEYQVHRKDGESIWVSENTRIVRDAAGRVAYLEGSVQDITERKRSEEALRASVAEFRNLAEAMPQLVWVARADGFNTYISRQWMDYSGLSLDESLGHGWTAAFHPDNRKPSRDAWHAAMANSSSYSTECRLRRADGAYRWWLIRGVPQFDAEGRVLKWFGTCTDIEEIKHAQLEVTRSNRALQRQRAELRVLFDLMPAMVWFKDTENGILRVNQRAADAAGKPVAEIEGRPSSEVYPEDAARFHETDLEVIRSGVAKLGSVEQVQSPRGGMRWVEIDKVPYFDEGGKVIGVVVMAQDVTARKQAEADVEKNHLELREISRRAGMSEVATNVLHNVGNVLNSVNVSASLMAESLDGAPAARLAGLVALVNGHREGLGAYLDSDPKGRHIPAALEGLSQEWARQQRSLAEELGSLRANVDHIKQIVAAQQGYAKGPGAVEAVDVADLVEQAVSMKQASFDEHGVRVVREFGGIPPVNAEKHRVLQILVNLVGNAGHACAEQGGSGRFITVRTAQSGERVTFTVSDNGSGIAPENLTRIFAHGFTTRPGGHGFGLHSGALAAAELGGSLRASSDGPGRGATFVLELPMPPVKAPA